MKNINISLNDDWSETIIGFEYKSKSSADRQDDREPFAVVYGHIDGDKCTAEIYKPNRETKNFKYCDDIDAAFKAAVSYVEETCKHIQHDLFAA
jgi:hypothetical protein